MTSEQVVGDAWCLYILPQLNARHCIGARRPGILVFLITTVLAAAISYSSYEDRQCRMEFIKPHAVALFFMLSYSIAHHSLNIAVDSNSG